MIDSQNVSYKVLSFSHQPRYDINKKKNISREIFPKDKRIITLHRYNIH